MKRDIALNALKNVEIYQECLYAVYVVMNSYRDDQYNLDDERCGCDIIGPYSPGSEDIDWLIPALKSEYHSTCNFLMDAALDIEPGLQQDRC
jgi:hypothetical protein